MFLSNNKIKKIVIFALLIFVLFLMYNTFSKYQTLKNIEKEMLQYVENKYNMNFKIRNFEVIHGNDFSGIQDSYNLYLIYDDIEFVVVSQEDDFKNNKLINDKNYDSFISVLFNNLIEQEIPNSNKEHYTNISSYKIEELEKEILANKKDLTALDYVIENKDSLFKKYSYIAVELEQENLNENKNKYYNDYLFMYENYQKFNIEMNIFLEDKSEDSNYFYGFIPQNKKYSKEEFINELSSPSMIISQEELINKRK